MILISFKGLVPVKRTEADVRPTLDLESYGFLFQDFTHISNTFQTDSEIKK